MAKPALGRGLSALLDGAPPKPQTAAPLVSQTEGEPQHSASDANKQVRSIPIDQIRPCALQPRKNFSKDALQELADSIREQGIVQPLIVRAQGDHFELIAGERRWRAAQLVELTEVPIVVRQADDRNVLELALIENLQRENLNPLEEALGYEQLIAQFGLTQEEASTKVGKSRTVIANALRLLKLPEEIRNYLRDARISVGHAKVILSLSRAEEQKLATERVIKGGFSVRQTEDLVATLQKKTGVASSSKGRSGTTAREDANTASIQQRLQERFGTKVQIRYKQGKGSVEIRFFDDADFERILQILGVEHDS